MKNISAPAVVGRFVNGVLVADLHDVYAHKKTVEHLFSYISQTKPTMRINLGDTFDFAGLREGCSAQDQYKGWQRPVAAGKEFIERFQPTDDIEGNHDYRVRKALESMSGLERYGASKVCAELDDMYKKIGTRRTKWGIGGPGAGLLRIGQQGFCHGYGSGDSVWKDMALAYCQNIMFGHIHARGMYVAKNIYRHVARSAPSLADNKKLKYQLGQKGALKHESGFVPFIYDKQHGLFHFMDAYWESGAFFIPELRIRAA